MQRQKKLSPLVHQRDQKKHHPPKKRGSALDSETTLMCGEDRNGSARFKVTVAVGGRKRQVINRNTTENS